MSSSATLSAAPFLAFPEPDSSGEIRFTPRGTEKTCKTAYWIWGELSASTVPIICIHGGPGYPSQHLKTLSLLHDTFKIPVVLYDQLGCGRSTHLPETRGDGSFWTIELFIAELENLLKGLGIKKHYIFGHSWGSTIGLQYAISQPAGLEKLILCSASISEATRAESVRTRRQQLPAETFEVFERCQREGRTDSEEYKAADLAYFKSYLLRMDPIPPEMIESMVDAEKDDTVTATLYGGTALPITGTMRDYDATDQVHLIGPHTVPGGVLLINGKWDHSMDIGIRPIFNRIQAKVKWIRFGESSHMAFREEPDDFVPIVGEFLLS